MNGQKVEIILRQSAYRVFHSGPDVKQLHIQKDPFAVLFQLVRQCQTAASQHAQTDFVKRNGIAKAFCQCESIKRVGHVKGDDQAVIGVGHQGLMDFGPF